MSDDISSEVKSRIRELCRQISVAHDLDEEIQAELYSHMEDKLLGYLNGEEKVTEDDALILVREHFGDPAVIRRLLREAHAKDVRMGFWRKIVLFFWAGQGVFVFENGLQVILIVGLMAATHMTTLSDTTRMVMKLLLAGTQIVSLLVLWSILRVWRRGLERGRLPWLLRQKWGIIEATFYWILGMVMSIIILNFFNVAIEYSQNSMLLRILDPNQTTKDLEVIMRFMPAGSGVLLYIVLIWWMEWPSRGMRSLLEGIGLIVFINILLFSAGILMNLFYTGSLDVGRRLMLLWRDSGIPFIAAIGIYLICDVYRRILDRKLERIV